MCLVALCLWRLSRSHYREGDLFKTFMAAYFSFRLAVEFIKPGAPILGLTAIQWACAAMLVYYSPDLPRLIGALKSERMAEKND